MEILLKKDVANLGYAGEIVKVKAGYAMNYLVPQGFATVFSIIINAEFKLQQYQVFS